MNKKIFIIGLMVCALFFCAIFIIPRIFNRNSLNHAPAPDTTGRNLTRYEGYTFHNDRRINFGIQPMWVPASAIIEVMKRDEELLASLKKYGYEIRWYDFSSGNDVNQFIKSGKLHGGIGGDMPALTLAAEMDIRIVSIIQYGACSIISRGLKSISNLEGKKIGYSRGSNAHFLLANSLSIMKIDLSKAGLVDMNVHEMPQKLMNGEIDAFSAWEPAPAIALKMDPGLTRTAKGYTLGFMYFSGSFFDAHAPLVREMALAQARAMKWMSAGIDNIHLSSRLALQAYENYTGSRSPLAVEDYSGLSKEDIIGIFRNPSIRPNMLLKNSSLHNEFKMLKDIGFIKKGAEWVDIQGKFIPGNEFMADAE